MNVLQFGFHCSALLAVGCAALALHFNDAANDLPALVFIVGHAVLLGGLAIVFGSRRNFGAYESPLQASAVKTASNSSKGAGPAASSSSLRNSKMSSAALKKASSKSVEMESGLLGAAALELVALPSLHSTAAATAAAAYEVDVSSLRVSAVPLDMVFSE